MVLRLILRWLPFWPPLVWKAVLPATGLGASAAALERDIQTETRNSVACESLAELFQEYDDYIASVFHKMAVEERQHTAMLEWLYVQRFGPLPVGSEPTQVDCKTLGRALDAGLCRVLKQKMAEKQRYQWFGRWYFGARKWLHLGAWFPGPCGKKKGKSWC